MIDKTIRRYAWSALGFLLFACGGAVGASMYLEIDGAVVAPGVLVVESNIKSVQHPFGGIVSELHVRDGDKVEAGTVIIRLDDTELRAALAEVRANISSHEAKLARLIAERDKLAEPIYSATSSATENLPGFSRAVEGELTLFETRRQTLVGTKKQLEERKIQLKNETQGLQLQLSAQRAQIELAKDELKDLDQLLEKGLVQRNRVTILRREVKRLEGIIGQIVSGIAQSKGQVSEIDLRILQLDYTLANEVAREIRETETPLEVYKQREKSAVDRMKRVEIRAPVAGFVHNLKMHTVGGVVLPGDVIMSIVPEKERLLIEARISPTDIDQVTEGTDARVRFTAFQQTTTPEFKGKLKVLGRDLTVLSDGSSHYIGRVTVEADELDKLGGRELVAGMPADIYLLVGRRTIASYLVKPLTDMLYRSLREQ
ncbi:MAG: HlyD family type I secretion periplasmic adaptor subunit [Pseudomonadota bacterium]